MENNDKQTTPQIYYRPLRKWIEVTPEQKRNWELLIDAARKAKQRAGACCIPYKKSYKCEGLCEECEYRCISQDAVLPLSIENETKIVRKTGAKNTFLADDAMTTEISIDSMILNRLLEEGKLAKTGDALAGEVEVTETATNPGKYTGTVNFTINYFSGN